MKNVYTASRINDRSIRDALRPITASPSTRQESQESLVLVPPIMSSRGRWPGSSRRGVTCGGGEVNEEVTDNAPGNQRDTSRVFPSAQEDQESQEAMETNG